MNRFFTLKLTIVALAIVFATVSASAPLRAGTTGALAGVVYDESGAVVAGASVTITSPSQQSTRTSGNNGEFSFLSLAPDTYNVEVRKAGYAPLSNSGVQITSDQSLRLTFTLTKASS